MAKQPYQRLGAHKGIQEIKAHPFLAGVQWTAAYHKELKPPILPEFGASNFDQEYTSLPSRLSIF